MLRLMLKTEYMYYPLCWKSFSGGGVFYKSTQESGGSFDSLNDLVREINAIKNKLIQCHPHYMGLKDYEAISIDVIQ